MSILRSTHRLFVPTLMTAAIVAACGGGGGGAPGSQLRQVPDAAKPSAVTGSTTMSCADGGDYECSGDTVLRTDNGVRLTSSGVFVYGKSTTDSGATPTDANGLDPVVPDTTAIADIRIRKLASGVVDKAAMILNQLDVFWDGTTERPRIIEAFEPSTGVTELVGGTVVTSTPLPLAPLHYDFNPGPPPTGTQANYANNRYFGAPETAGIAFTPRADSNDPDRTTAQRQHSDGDIRAPAGMPPNSKGFRDLTVYSYADANLASWRTKETAFIDEWTPANVTATERSTLRTGITAFGNTTLPANVPTTGEGEFKGIVYGWYAENGTSNVVFLATARVVVNFQSRQADVYVESAKEEQPPQAAIPAAGFVSRAAFGDAGTNVANYLVGTVSTDVGSLSGGLGARFFGSTANEIAGSFNLKNATTGAATVGGFIARR